MDERRKHQRFQLRGNCLISHGKLVGTVIDLSLGGMSFTCLSSYSDGCNNSSCNNVEIFCTENMLKVPGLTMNIIETEKIPGEFLPNFWISKFRARFDNLREEQIALLENLIGTATQQNLLGP